MERASRIRIIPATPDHADFITNAVRATFDEHARRNPAYFVERRRDAFVANIEVGLREVRRGPRYFVAEVKGLPAGYVAVLGHRSVRVIQDIYVAPEGRGQGVGLALLAYVEALARDTGARLLHATVWDGNEASHRLFRGAGFTTVTPLIPPRIGRLFPALRATDYQRHLRS